LDELQTQESKKVMTDSKVEDASRWQYWIDRGSKFYIKINTL